MIYSKLSMQRYEKFREMQKERAFFLFHTSDAATKNRRIIWQLHRKLVTLQPRSTKQSDMARQIAETPILFGEDAKRFENNMKNVQPATEEERSLAEKAYQWMRSMATFAM